MEKKPKIGEKTKRAFKILGLIFASIFLLIGIVLGSVFYVLGSLDKPFFQTKIQQAVEENLGLKITFSKLSISPFSQILLENLIIPQPKPYDVHAPYLFRVKKIHLK